MVILRRMPHLKHVFFLWKFTISTNFILLYPVLLTPRLHVSYWKSLNALDSYLSISPKPVPPLLFSRPFTSTPAASPHVDLPLWGCRSNSLPWNLSPLHCQLNSLKEHFSLCLSSTLIYLPNKVHTPPLGF